MTEPSVPADDLQVARLLLALYRQGWRDAVAHLHARSRAVDREFKEMYARLQPDSTEAQP